MNPVEHLKEKVQKENLWFFILSVLEKNRSYGYELRSLIQKSYGFLAGNVTAYHVLYSLKSGGYVKKKKEGMRRYYEITPEGRDALKEARIFLRKTAKG
ncbi:MAG: PadR family transcriptional regulator [Candidatus Aenigmarchaeota archaeon]|nr:PadR family transcriptional regulator [Candidatus Aenigmarchaeota archaeon]